MWRPMVRRRVKRVLGRMRVEESWGWGWGAWDRKEESKIDVKYVGIKAY